MKISKKKVIPIFRLFAESKKYWTGLMTAFIFAVLAGFFKTYTSILWGRAVDFGIGGKVSSMLNSVVIIVVIILLDAIRTAMLYKIIGHTTEGMFLTLRIRAFEKINKGDVSVLENKFHTGDTATRLNFDIYELSNFIAGDVSNFLRLNFQGIIAVVACIILSWQLSATYFILLPISVWTVKKISKPIQNQRKKAMDSTGSAVSFASDVISGLLTVKSFGIQEEMKKRFEMSTNLYYEQMVKTEKISMVMTGIKYATRVIQLMTLFLVGSILVSYKIISVGTVLAFITLSSYVNEPFSQIDYMIKTVRNGFATAERVYEVLDIPDEKKGEITHTHRNDEFFILAKNLSFSYDGDLILDGVDLSIPKGKKIALVGPSGCGKSTIIKLLCKFYLPIDGEMIFLGRNAENWEPESWRKNISIVTQESGLFDTSIYENIAFGKMNITKQEVEKSLRDVGLWEFVDSLPNKIDFNIGEFGGRLSGGQRQRICIARAMVKNAPLVLLDEATSALDTQSEHEVQVALSKLLEGKSAVIVAHRLTTVQNADYIYYLEGGRVLEEGTPQRLIEKGGRYYAMCLSQDLISEEVSNG